MAVLTLPQMAKAFSKVPGEIKFAGIVALTRTAKLIQGEVKEELKETFTLRNTFTARTIKIKPATKQSPEAEVFTTAWFLPTQDIGGRRSGEFWVPTENLYKRTGRPKDKVLPKGIRGEKILNKSFPVERVGRNASGRAKPFRTKTKSGSEVIALRQRSEANPIDILYLITDSVKIKKQEFFQEPAEEFYTKNFEEQWIKAFNQFVLKRTP